MTAGRVWAGYSETVREKSCEAVPAEFAAQTVKAVVSAVEGVP